jgi:putative restriction endonuclease
MAIRLVVAVTDRDWFNRLSQTPGLDEVNFWAPSASSFKALEPGELFLFKLHAPDNFVVGGGIFARAMVLPCTYAWEAFGEANGAASLQELRERVVRYRREGGADRSDFRIGCRILTQPFFLPRAQWIPVPQSWSPNIVKFKTYGTDDPEGLALWEAAQVYLTGGHDLGALAERRARYGEPILIKPRLGQGAFRVLVTDIYHQRCAVTGERTLPALEAAHIRPFAEGGPHEASNGLLLRRDIHSLFDSGYVTVTPEHRFEVSRRIKEEYENGRDYYRLHGAEVAIPQKKDDAPDREALSWHNANRFLG